MIARAYAVFGRSNENLFYKLMNTQSENNDRQEGQPRTFDIITPAPPQVVDPSVPPGSGQYETYYKGEAVVKGSARKSNKLRR